MSGDYPPKLRKPRATKKEMAERRARKEARGNHTWLPGLVQERERLYNDRMRSMRTTLNQDRVCNASMGHTTYKTGDGEVLQPARPGSMYAYGLPSRGMGT